MNSTSFITLNRVALRYKAIYLDTVRGDIDIQSAVTAPVLAFTRRLREAGFGMSEELLHALNGVSVDRLLDITNIIKEVMGMELNWAPLVKGWDEPTGETRADHLVTLVANIFGEEAGFKGTRLPCGHLIPEGTFPLERYNGCPFCGTPFVLDTNVYKGQGSKLKELRLMTMEDMERLLNSLLLSKTPLDASQRDSLGLLLSVLPLPAEVDIAMKETAMLVVKLLVALGKDSEAGALLRTPTDVLRYLWYEKTGQAQIIEPKTLAANARRLYCHMFGPLDRSMKAADQMKSNLRLKYTRPQCRRVALWLNALPMSARQAAETMNPKRGMWVRMIRALRLGEYSRREGFSHLAEILDVFYNQSYETWQGTLDKARQANDATTMLTLLSQRPGLFARCLFATMLRFGLKPTVDAFNAVTDRLPSRLLLSLVNAAELYFNSTRARTARTITGIPIRIAPNKLLSLYDEAERREMVDAVKSSYIDSISRRFAAQPTEAHTIYIDPELYNIPVSVGDRSTTIQDTSCALMGTHFPVEGDAVRLFLQWGKGLHAQHLDMDLSCRIYKANGGEEDCAYYHLTCLGAKHSGDIRSIPEMVGTAEYIELSLPELEAGGAQYAIFTCNAYSCGRLSPNLVVGWMDSAYPMTISEKSGVAYDPSCVQHMVRVSEANLSKGLVFGILDVAAREIIWLEMPIPGQTIQSVNFEKVISLLNSLKTKITIGELLDLKAQAQHLERHDTPDGADEAYTYEWALNPADVTALLQ